MTKQCPIHHRRIPNIAPTLRELFCTEFHITTRQCPTHHKAMSHSIQSDAPIPLGECLQTEIQPITRQWLTHYRTVSNPLEDRFTTNQTHYSTMSHPFQNNIPPTRRLFNTEIKFIARQCPNHHTSMSHPIQSSVPFLLGVCLRQKSNPLQDSTPPITQQCPHPFQNNVPTHITRQLSPPNKQTTQH